MVKAINGATSRSTEKIRHRCTMFTQRYCIYWG